MLIVKRVTRDALVDGQGFPLMYKIYDIVVGIIYMLIGGKLQVLLYG